MWWFQFVTSGTHPAWSIMNFIAIWGGNYDIK